MDAASAFDRHVFASDITLIVQQLCDAADVITRHTPLAAVAVEAAHLCVCDPRMLDEHDPVSADPVVRSAQRNAERFRAGDTTVKVLNKDVVVSA